MGYRCQENGHQHGVVDADVAAWVHNQQCKLGCSANASHVLSPKEIREIIIIAHGWEGHNMQFKLTSHQFFVLPYLSVDGACEPIAYLGSHSRKRILARKPEGRCNRSAGAHRHICIYAESSALFGTSYRCFIMDKIKKAKKI